MDVTKLAEIVGADFYTGVPDSQLKALCDYLIDTYGIRPENHIIAANEGNCVSLAAGYHLATGKVPVVYMQNSGEGNIINPVASLLNEEVYGIPMLFIIGWRGEPGIKDEPQHVYQGRITVKLLDDMGIQSFVIGPETEENSVKEAMRHFRNVFLEGKQAAFIIRRNALFYGGKVEYANANRMTRKKSSSTLWSIPVRILLSQQQGRQAGNCLKSEKPRTRVINMIFSRLVLWGTVLPLHWESPFRKRTQRSGVSMGTAQR